MGAAHTSQHTSTAARTAGGAAGSHGGGRNDAKGAGAHHVRVLDTRVARSKHGAPRAAEEAGRPKARAELAGGEDVVPVDVGKQVAVLHCERCAEGQPDVACPADEVQDVVVALDGHRGVGADGEGVQRAEGNPAQAADGGLEWRSSGAAAGSSRGSAARHTTRAEICAGYWPLFALRAAAPLCDPVLWHGWSRQPVHP